MTAKFFLLVPASAIFLLSPSASAGPAKGLDVLKSVDHIVSLVRPENYESARTIFSEDLGFEITPTLISPLGSRNSIIWFEDRTYLELATYSEANAFTADIVAFLDTTEGAKAYASEVASIDQAVIFFDDRGIPHTGAIAVPPLVLEDTGEILPSPLWSQLLFTASVSPDNSLFILDYAEPTLEEMFDDFPELAPQPHPNTALRLDAMWLAVEDLESATQLYQELGFFVRWRYRWLPELGVRATRIRDRTNDIILMQPVAPGPIADFAAERTEGIVGARIQVASIDTAQDFIESATGLELQRFRTAGDIAVRIPAEATHGLIVELFQAPKPKHKSKYGTP